MKCKNLMLVLILILYSVMGFTQNVNQLKTTAYQLSEQGDYKLAIDLYHKVLNLEPNDFESQYELGKLYYKTEKYSNAARLLNPIYFNDKKNKELIDMIGKSYMLSGKLYLAVKFYIVALENIPNNIPIYFQLAKAHSWKGDMHSAINVYKKILELDNTYSEAWQGIGKMYYWLGNPYSAAKNYRKAISLDPSNKVLIKEYNEVEKSMTFQTYGKWSFINEKERHYDIDAIVQKYGVSKILSDNLKLSANFLLDYSNKRYSDSDLGKTKKTFNNAFVNVDYSTGNSKFKLYTGYTFTDKKLSSYGLSWNQIIRTNYLEFSNTITGGYDYYYYWNEVGEHSINEEFSVKYQNVKLALNGKLGMVDSLLIYDTALDKSEVGFNSVKGYGGSLSYEIMSKPKVNIAANYSYLDYKYKSKLYYTPAGRQLYGLSTSIYYPMNHFYFYGSFGYNLGSEYYYDFNSSKLETVYIDVDNWSADFEVGYELNTFSISLGASRFYNPYYASFNSYLTSRLYF